MREALITIYLIFKNDFITIGGFADYYHINDREAETLINLGRRFHKEKNEGNYSHP